MSLARRLWNTLRPARVQRDIDRELSFHLAERVDQLRDEGLSKAEARRRARIQFGNPTLQRERTRDVDIAEWLDAGLRNVRYAVRSLVRTPGFTATVVLTLALGIGANTAVFSAMDAVLMRPLPFADADRLVRLSQVTEDAGSTNLAAARLRDWNRLTSTFEAITGHVVEDVSDTTAGVPERVRRATVLPRFLQVWGVTPVLGRGFTEVEHTLGGPSAVMISERFWRGHFNADRDVLTRAVRMGERSYSIVGVLPASFAFPDRDVDWWVPDWVNAPWTQARGFSSSTGIGRLKAGVTLEQARADLAVVQSQLGTQYPDTDRAIRPGIVPLKETVVGGARGSLWLLFGAVSVLLLIACTNIAALLLSRGARHEHDVTVRYALGASRASVVVQLLTEVAVLAVAGAAAGLVVAVGASAMFRALAPDLPRLDEVGIDARVLLYTMVSAVAVVLLCGLFPAVRTARSAGPSAGAGRAQVSAGHSLQWLLVGMQVALSVTLLAGAGLLIRSIEALSRVDPGFEGARVLTLRVSGSFGEERDYNRTVQRINRTLDAIAALPGVAAAATTTILPGIPDPNQAGGPVQSATATEFQLVEVRPTDAPPMIAEWRIVSPSYFDTLHIPITAGELCRRPDGAAGTTEVLVNRSFADRYLLGRSPIGLHLTGNSPDRIVGIVADAREKGIDRDAGPAVYSCFSAPTPFPWFLVRTSGDPLTVASAVRLKINELEPLRSVYDIAPLEQRIVDAYAQNRLRTIVLALFAVTALSLACLGVYGTLSYVVSLRRREVGLRVALGAMRSRIVSQFLLTVLRVVGLACAAGLAMSVAFGHALSGMLFGVSPSDPATLAGVVGIVLAVATLAALVPAARAVLAEPIRALREG
ncbi:MAG TPA: ABC transporter permease [Vicinamibacterales bacterium]|nr:ABC transporter permease [Vicinamibacterales bacterium]